MEERLDENYVCKRCEKVISGEDHVCFCANCRRLTETLRLLLDAYAPYYKELPYPSAYEVAKQSLEAVE